jgi:hypothetical protein
MRVGDRTFDFACRWQISPSIELQPHSLFSYKLKNFGRT